MKSRRNLRAQLRGTADDDRDLSTPRQDAMLCRSYARADGERRRGVPGAARLGPPPRQSQVPRQCQRNVTEAWSPSRDLGSVYDEGQGASMLCCTRTAHAVADSRAQIRSMAARREVTVKLQRKCWVFVALPATCWYLCLLLSSHVVSDTHSLATSGGSDQV